MEVEVLEPKIVTLPKELFIFVEERLDRVVQEKSQRKITWTDKHNTEREITKLSDAHAYKLSYWLKPYPNARKIIQAELERRATGNYPPNFDEMISEYKKNPDIWRLKVY
jgi:hypothetical protein